MEDIQQIVMYVNINTTLFKLTTVFVQRALAWKASVAGETTDVSGADERKD